MKAFTVKNTNLPVCPHCGFVKELSPREWHDINCGGGEKYKCKECKKSFACRSVPHLTFYTSKG